MSQLTHWPAFPCSRYPLGDSLTRWVLGALRHDGQRFPHPLGAVNPFTRWVLGAWWPAAGIRGLRHRINAANDARRRDGQRRRIRWRKAGSVPVVQWGRVGPKAEGAQTGRYHEQFFIF